MTRFKRTPPRSASGNRVREVALTPAEVEHWTRAMNKSLWKQKAGHVWNFLCPLCRCERRVPFRRRPGGIHYFQVGLTAAIFALATSPWLEWKGIISFVPFWMVFETVYRLRMRVALRCSQCGFDPILYLRDTTMARAGVEKYWRKKFEELGKPFPEKGKPYPPPVAPEAAQASSAAGNPLPAQADAESSLDRE